MCPKVHDCRKVPGPGAVRKTSCQGWGTEESRPFDPAQPHPDPERSHRRMEEAEPRFRRYNKNETESWLYSGKVVMLGRFGIPKAEKPS